LTIDFISDSIMTKRILTTLGIISEFMAVDIIRKYMALDVISEFIRNLNITSEFIMTLDTK